jgi:hypothetical protein
MARTAITVSDLVLNSTLANPAGTTIDATNHHVINDGDCERLILRITNTTASTKIATVKAGDNPPALAAGQGDLSVSLTDGSTTPQTAFVVLESARFKQSDGTILIDLAASMTGSITAFKLPKGV